MCDACHSVLVSDLHWRPYRHAFLLRLSGLMAPNSSGLYLKNTDVSWLNFISHYFVIEVFNIVGPLAALRLSPSIPRFLVSGPSLWERTQLRSAVRTLQIPAPHTAHSQTDTSSLMVNQWNCSHHTVSVPTVEAGRLRDVRRVRPAG